MINKSVFRGFIDMCRDGWERGWHERNGGNLSRRMIQAEVFECAEHFNAGGAFLPLGLCVPNMAGEFFIVTGGGSHMRNVPAAPEENIGVVEIDGTGSGYRVVWGLTKGGRPTSELAGHILNHSAKAETARKDYRVIYHAHPANTVALSYLLPLTDRAFTRALWKSGTECAAVFPRGVGVVDFKVPGSTELAEATGEKIRLYDAVVWAFHGLFCAGADYDDAFGLVHTIEKAAEIYVKVRSAGYSRQTIKDSQLLRLAEGCGAELNGEFVGV